MTFKQLYQYASLLWKLRMLEIKMIRLDTHRLKLYVEAYKICKAKLDKPEIAEVIEKYDPNIWNEFAVRFVMLRTIDKCIDDLRKWEDKELGKDRSNPKTGA